MESAGTMDPLPACLILFFIGFTTSTGKFRPGFFSILKYHLAVKFTTVKEFFSVTNTLTCSVSYIYTIINLSDTVVRAHYWAPWQPGSRIPKYAVEAGKGGYVARVYTFNGHITAMIGKQKKIAIAIHDRKIQYAGGIEVRHELLLRLPR